MNLSERKIYTAVDEVRLFFAVCIVAIHTNLADALPETAGYWLQQGVLRLAVPFFFVTSGYFLMEKIRRTGDPAGAVRRYVMRLIVPFLVCDIANAVMNVIYICMTQDTELRYAVESVVRKGIWYPYGAMWYVAALIVGSVLLLPFLGGFGKKGGGSKTAGLDIALALGAVLYAWALLCNNYYFLVEGTAAGDMVNSYMETFVSARNGIFVGFFLLAVGMKASCIDASSVKGSLVKVIVPLSFILYLAEIALLRDRSYTDDRALYVMQIFLAPALLLLLTAVKGTGEDKMKNAVLMRKMSAWMYFTHRFVLILILIICTAAGAENASQKYVLLFVVVTAVCVISFFIQRRIREKRLEARGIYQDHSLF